LKRGENSSLYQLILRLPKRSRIRVGRLGTFDFPAGFYVYTGSAKRGLFSRIQRHRSENKKRFWHIDYLLAKAQIHDVRVFRNSDLSECDLARRVASKPEAKIIAPGFGASDCRCQSHLVFFRSRQEL
jgi:Uri superfamily endonuclease